MMAEREYARSYTGAGGSNASSTPTRPATTSSSPYQYMQDVAPSTQENHNKLKLKAMKKGKMKRRMKTNPVIKRKICYLPYFFYITTE